MKLTSLDIDSFCEDLPEITSFKLFESTKFSKNGLFSPQIFGPTQSWRCSCPRSIYHGPHSGKLKCNVCGVDITSSDERSKRYAKICLPFPILNPLVYILLIKSKPSIKIHLDNILYYRYRYYINENQELCKFTVDDYSKIKNEDAIYGISGILKLINYLCEINSKKKELLYIKNNPNLILINNIIVTPPNFRNYTKNSNNTYNVDNLNKFYTLILKRTSRINELPYKLDESHELYRLYFKSIQQAAIDIFQYILDRLSKKQGLLRKNILGKRCDWSARAVITPDPTLNCNECSIPYFVLLEIYKPQLVVYLVNKKICKLYTESSNLIKKSLTEKNYDLYDHVKDFIKDELVMLNRQPSLHRGSMFVFNIVLNKGNTCGLHPMLCNSLNADFDGDSVSLYFSMTYKIKKDMSEKIGVWNNILNPTNGQLSLMSNQDILLGINHITK